MKMKTMIKNSIKITFIILILNSIFCSCVYDKTTDITVINRSKESNYVICYTDSFENYKRPKEIQELYTIWETDSGIQNNHLFNPKYEGTYFPIVKERIEHIGGFGRDKFCFCIINIDLLFDNYQKGLPVDSFSSYEIKKYTREELKKANYEIIIND